MAKLQIFDSEFLPKTGWHQRGVSVKFKDIKLTVNPTTGFETYSFLHVTKETKKQNDPCILDIFINHQQKELSETSTEKTTILGISKLNLIESLQKLFDKFAQKYMFSKLNST